MIDELFVDREAAMVPVVDKILGDYAEKRYSLGHLIRRLSELNRTFQR